VWGTIPALTARAATRFPDHRAIADGDKHMSFGELFDSARRFGAALVGAGVEPGDRVAIWLCNSLEWVVSVLGLSMAGAAVVPVNTRFKGREAAEILRRSRARVLVTTADFIGVNYVEMLRSSEVDLPELRTTLVTTGTLAEGTGRWDAFLDSAGAADLDELDRRRAAVTPDDTSDILFTSGTTGVPKGVPSSHARSLSMGSDWVAMTGLVEGDRYLMVNPYFHLFGLQAGILPCLGVGATMLPEPTLDVGRLFGRVHREKVTVLPGPPTLYQTLLDSPDRDKHDLSSLRVALTGAAEIPVELIKRIHKELPFSLVISAFGQTEVGTACSTRPGDDFEAIASTVGRPRPGLELRIVAEDGTAMASGQPGEIWLRGAKVMSGYLDNPDSTSKALTDDGWLRTGDIGALDEAGRVRIVGRLKDMFVVGGFNVYPAEIENVLLRRPDVHQAAVIGVPDSRLGEVGMAFVVLREEHQTSAADIVSWCREQMANYKAPRVVRIVPELPLNATGKVQKDVLRTMAEQTEDAAHA
jgi:acyl-CoA synthetase (AMP-forming)/AMP-acid ligase II